MRNLMHAEWIKLTRRPVTWILLGVFLFLMLLSYLAMFFAVGLHDGLFGVTITILGEQIDQLRLELSFPGVFGGVLGQINSFGGICALILAAGSFGSEYGWGTLRLQLARQPQRGRYLVAKLLVLLLVLLIGMFIALVFGALLALLFGSILGDVGSISARDVLLLPVGMLRSLYVILPYVLFTVAACMIGRSALAGVAGGLVFLFLDSGTATLSFLADLGNPLITFLITLPLQPNINTLIVMNRRTYGFDPSTLGTLNTETLPPPWQAFILIGLYSALFFGYAYYSFTRRDIGGAS
jgi:ABC-type transport system involved in multi-copper enzyme maturation permease subunit